MKPSVGSLTTEQKRAMLAHLVKNPPAVGPTAFVLQAVVLQQMVFPNLNWNICSTIRYFDKLDPDTLRPRLQKLVERHPALRTTYEVNREGQIVQRVHPAPTMTVSVVDATTWTPEALRTRLRSDVCQPFDLHELPMCRLRLYRRLKDDILQFEVHHCAADLWSLEIITAELERPPDDAPPPSFAEFCAWQHAWFAGTKARAMADWWTRTLDGCQPLAFADTYVDDPVSHIPFRIDSDIFALARHVCRTHRLTLFNLVLSVLQVTMRRWRHVDDFVIGCAAANRPAQRFDRTVGWFANPVMYRQKLQEVHTWEELWLRNRTTISDVLDHQFYPVLQTLPYPRTDVLFMFQQFQQAQWVDGDAPPGEPTGIRSTGVSQSPLGPREVLYLQMPTLPCPVMLETLEQKDSLLGVLRFRKTCFPRTEGERYVQDFVSSMRAAVENPTAPID